MKLLLFTFFCLYFIQGGLTHAQEPPLALTEKKQSKPFLFASLPEEFEVATTELHKVFSGDVNGTIVAQLSSQLRVEGTLVDKNQHTPGSLTVNVRVHNYQNALFNLTIRFLADNSTSIQGRMIHPRYGDVLELFKKDGRYYMRKKLLRLYMSE
jgi:hypothetical protein